MGRKAKNYTFYNNEYKLKFLTNQKQYYYTYIDKAYSLESVLNKDLYSFDIIELEEFAQRFSLKKETDANQLTTFLTRYFGYAMEQNVIKKNVMDDIKESFDSYINWGRQFVNSSYSYLRKSDIIEIINTCLNFQDAILIYLLFLGFQIQEIINLRYSDIKNNYVELVNRKIYIDELASDLIDKSKKEDNYTLYVGEGKTHKRGSREFLSSDKDYLLKRTIGGNNKIERSDVFIYPRIRDILNNSNHFSKSAKDVKYAGMIYHAWINFFEKDSEKIRLSNKEIEQVSCYFGDSTVGCLSSILTFNNIAALYKETGVKNCYSIQTQPFYPKWWRIKEENGEIGEKIAKNIFNTFFSSVRKMIDSAGYDFECNKNDHIYRIEVKSVSSKRGQIFISRNELEKAVKFNEEYWLCIILITDKEKLEGECYLFNDPINLLVIEDNYLSSRNNYEFEKLILKPHIFVFNINENFLTKSISISEL